MGSHRKDHSRNKSSTFNPPLKCLMCDKPAGNYLSTNKPSKFCSDHTCHAGSQCRSWTDTDKKFCEKHSKCTQLGCTAQVEVVEGSSFKYSWIGCDYWLCPDHCCQMKTRNERCYLPRRDSNTQYCAEHSKEIKCSIPDCPLDRTSTSRMCENHTCQEPNCSRQTFTAGLDPLKCYRHQPCAAPGCATHASLDFNGIPKTFCANHGQCTMIGGCDAIIHPDSKFCDNHKCCTHNCNRPRDFQSVAFPYWCRKHGCSVAGCDDRITDPTNSRLKNCPRHTCQQHDCFEKANESGSGSYFCPTHTCINTVCQQAAKVPGEYCVEEACVKDGCGKARDTRSSHFPTLCVYHRSEEDRSGRSYSLSGSPYLGPSCRVSRVGSYGSGIRRPRGLASTSYDEYYQGPDEYYDYRGRCLRPGANAVYDQMDDVYHRSTPRRTARR